MYMFFFKELEKWLYVFYSNFRAEDDDRASFISLFREKLQLYVSYSIFRTEDDGRVSFILLFRKKHFSYLGNF